jgi:hypothetical protein
LGEHELLGDLGVAHSCCEQFQDTELASGETAGVLPGGGPGSVLNVLHVSLAQGPGGVGCCAVGAELLQLAVRVTAVVFAGDASSASAVS